MGGLKENRKRAGPTFGNVGREQPAIQYAILCSHAFPSSKPQLVVLQPAALPMTVRRSLSALPPSHLESVHVSNAEVAEFPILGTILQWLDIVVHGDIRDQKLELARGEEATWTGSVSWSASPHCWRHRCLFNLPSMSTMTEGGKFHLCL